MRLYVCLTIETDAEGTEEAVDFDEEEIEVPEGRPVGSCCRLSDKKRCEYFDQRLLEIPIGKLVEGLAEITEPFQDFVSVR